MYVLKNPRLAVRMAVPVLCCVAFFVPPSRRSFVINRIRCASQESAGRMQHVGEVAVPVIFFVCLDAGER